MTLERDWDGRGKLRNEWKPTPRGHLAWPDRNTRDTGADDPPNGSTHRRRMRTSSSDHATRSGRASVDRNSRTRLPAGLASRLVETDCKLRSSGRPVPRIDCGQAGMETRNAVSVRSTTPALTSALDAPRLGYRTGITTPRLHGKPRGRPACTPLSARTAIPNQLDGRVPTRFRLAAKPAPHSEWWQQNWREPQPASRTSIGPQQYKRQAPTFHHRLCGGHCS